MRLLWISLVLCLPLLAAAQNRSKSVAAYNMGLQFIAQGKHREAIQSFDKAIMDDSVNYDAWIKRGFVKSIVGDFEGELYDYNHVIVALPDHVFAYISRGSAYVRLKQPEKGLQDFNTAIRLDPSNPEAYNNRGFARKALGDEAGACSDWKMSRKLGNEEAAIILKNNYCK